MRRRQLAYLRPVSITDEGHQLLYLVVVVNASFILMPAAHRRVVATAGDGLVEQIIIRRAQAGIVQEALDLGGQAGSVAGTGQPAIAALATLEFTWIFTDYLWAIVLLRSDKLKPVTAGLATLQGQYIMDWTVIISGALLATIPSVLVFIFLQRYFIEGLTLGATKG